jgi:hypothetical protein
LDGGLLWLGPQVAFGRGADSGGGIPENRLAETLPAGGINVKNYNPQSFGHMWHVSMLEPFGSRSARGLPLVRSALRRHFRVVAL